MSNRLSQYAEAAAETEMLQACAPSPLNSPDCYVIFQSRGEKPTVVKFVKVTQPTRKRRSINSGARTEATWPQKAMSSPLAATLASLPFVSNFF